MSQFENFSFDDFAAFCPDLDIESLRERFNVMLDLNGAVFRHTIGFHFSLGTKSDEVDFRELVDMFDPVALYVGTIELHKKLEQLGFQSTHIPWFEEGGFMVVLKTPVSRKKGS